MIVGCVMNEGAAEPSMSLLARTPTLRCDVCGPCMSRTGVCGARSSSDGWIRAETVCSENDSGCEPPFAFDYASRKLYAGWDLDDEPEPEDGASEPPSASASTSERGSSLDSVGARGRVLCKPAAPAEH